MEQIEGYHIDDENYYVTDEIFRGRLDLKKCTRCGNYLNFVYAEKYSYFESVGIMMIMGVKIYGLECDICACGYIYNDE
jgi:hypothetical protein